MASSDAIANYTNAFSTLFAASHIGSGIAVAGVVLNLTLLAVIVGNWKTLIWGSSNIGLAVLAMVVISIIHALLIATLDELWVETQNVEFFNNQTGILDTTVAPDTLASFGYLLLTLLFASNLLLALERHSFVRWNSALSRKAVAAVYASALIFFAFFVAAFAIPSDGVSWTFLPLGKPCIWDYDTQSCRMTSFQVALFSVGLAYFPLVAIAICFLYESSYFLVAELFQAEDPEYDAKTGKLIAHDSVKLQKAILFRCVFMSIGLVAFYVPSIVMMFIAISNNDVYESIATNQNLLVAITALPSLDPLWTPIMILLFQNEFRDAFVSAFKTLFSRRRDMTDVIEGGV